MIGSEKQVAWASEIKVVVDRHVTELNTKFLVQLKAESPEDKIESYLIRWNTDGLPNLSSDSAEFYIDNFKDVLKVPDDEALNIVFFYGLVHAIYPSLPRKRTKAWVSAYNSIQTNEDLLFNKHKR